MHCSNVFAIPHKTVEVEINKHIKIKQKCHKGNHQINGILTTNGPDTRPTTNTLPPFYIYTETPIEDNKQQRDLEATMWRKRFVTQ